MCGAIGKERMFRTPSPRCALAPAKGQRDEDAATTSCFPVARRITPTVTITRDDMLRIEVISTQFGPTPSMSFFYTRNP
jgi:hypothetical protein